MVSRYVHCFVLSSPGRGAGLDALDMTTMTALCQAAVRGRHGMTVGFQLRTRPG
jgi:hypothetical protein